MLANVILATLIPYLMVLLFCVVVVPIEAAILFKFERSVIGFGRAVSLTAIANIASWIAGVFIALLIPVPVTFRTGEAKPEYFFGIMVGFVVAFVLSWLIEYWMLQKFRRVAFQRLFLATGIANAVSYASIFAIMIAYEAASR